MRANDRRSLGRTGVQLTQLGFGGGAIGELFAPIPEVQAQATLAAAWQSGTRYFDTAPWYGRGLSELRTGHFLRQQDRDAFVLSTKVGRVLTPSADPTFDRSPWVGGLSNEAAFDYSYDGIMRSFEHSLQRLGLTRVDLLLIHDLDHRHLGGDSEVAAHMRDLTKSGFRALEELRRAGAVKGIGAGINETRTIAQFLDAVEVDLFLVALCYTLLDQSALPSTQRGARNGAGFIIGGVYNSGILATGAVPGAKYNYADAPAEMMEKVARIEAIARRHDVPLPAVALQFPLGHPSVASVIPGGLAPDQISRNIQAIETQIDPQLWLDLKMDGLLAEGVPVPV